MDKQPNRLEMEIKLQLNKRLYEGGHISEDMYRKATELILKGH